VNARHVGLLAALSGIWGASYLLIRWAIDDLSAPVVVVGRTATAALVLWLLIVIQGGPTRAAMGDIRRRPGMALLLGVVAIAAPFLLITYGEIVVPTGLTAVLIASAPIFVALMAPMLDRGEILQPRQWAGLIVGILGVGLLVGVDLVDTAKEALGAFGIILAAIFYAASGFIVKRSYAGIPPIVTSLASVASSAVLTLPLIAVDPPTEIPGPLAIVSVLILGVFGTALAFVIYYRLMAEVGVGRASLVAYLIPGVALVYGATLLDEPITWATIVGFGLVLVGTVLAARRTRPLTTPPS
jgi:drug/metabolite transporter (DMT)-like permease